MASSKKPSAKGEITYHVGWKKGTITMKDSIQLVPLSRKDSILHRFIWRPVVFLPASFDMFLICALPLVSFIAILVLVYLLNHS
jgi:hypothetical protein